MQHRALLLSAATSTLFLALAACSAAADPVEDDAGAAGTGGTGGSFAAGAAGTGTAGTGTAGTGAGGGFSGSSAAGTTGAGGDCGGTFVEGKRLPASLLFVVDYSWSMCQDPSKRNIQCASPASKAKWSVFAGAFTTLVDTLPDDTGAGLVYYPDNQTDTSASALCATRKTPHVPIALLSKAGQRDALKALPPQMTDASPVNQTPTAAAVSAMVDHLAAVPEADLPGVRALVLVTDGKATCGNTAAELVAAVKKGAAAKPAIRTFVIGVPGSSGYRTELSDAAVAGGTAPKGCSSAGPTYCHFDMTAYTNPDELAPKLAQALDDVRGKAAISCDYEVPAGTEVGLVNVSWADGSGAPASLGYDPSCKGGGWHWDDPAKPTRIVLCDDVCGKINGASNPKLSIQLGCPTVEIK